MEPDVCFQDLVGLIHIEYLYERQAEVDGDVVDGVDHGAADPPLGLVSVQQLLYQALLGRDGLVVVEIREICT